MKHGYTYTAFNENDCYKAGQYITPTGIMVHSTGANNPRLSRYLPGDEVIGYNAYGNHWNKPGLDVCVHGFIGKDEGGAVRVYQTLPWDMRGWHCGGAGNGTHISFEICEDGRTTKNTSVQRMTRQRSFAHSFAGSTVSHLRT